MVVRLARLRHGGGLDRLGHLGRVAADRGGSGRVPGGLGRGGADHDGRRARIRGLGRLGSGMREAIAAGLKFFAGVQEDDMEEADALTCPAEFRVSLSLSSAVFMIRDKLVAAYRAEETCPPVDLDQLKQQARDIVDGRRTCYPLLLPVPKPRGKPWSIDHLFVVRRAGRPSVAHVIEFKVARNRPLLPLLADALEQCTKYQLVDVNGAELRFSAFVFDDSGQVVAGAQPLSLVEAVRLVHEMRSGNSTAVFLAVCALPPRNPKFTHIFPSAGPTRDCNGKRTCACE